MQKSEITIRPYMVEDKSQVRNICLVTASEHFRDEKMHKLLFTAYCDYYIEREPHNCFVGVNGGEVAGYILCAENAVAWAEDFRKEFLDGLEEDSIRQYCINSTETPLAFSADYPAHLHIDLLPKYQRMGLGTRLMDTLVNHLKGKGIPGLMLGVGANNVGAQAFYGKYGFSVLEKQTGSIAMGVKLK